MISISKKQVTICLGLKKKFFFLARNNLETKYGGWKQEENIARKIMKLVIRWRKNHFL